MKKTKVAIVLLFVLIALPLFGAEESAVKSSLSILERQDLISQLKLNSVNPAIPAQSSAIAVSDISYLVTPGDVYSLVYYDLSVNASTGSNINVSIQVDANYGVYVPVIGQINAKGMTYMQLRDYVCSRLSESRPYSNPHMSFVNCGVFQVYVCGEVECNQSVETWRLARLSDFCGFATKYASSRNVTVIYADGREVSYDLYEALNNNYQNQNPFVEPGCTIRFNKAEKLVAINGSVCKPGQYQVLADETIADLINCYANGFDPAAISSQVVVKGYRNGEYISSLVTEKDFGSYTLCDMDTVYVSSMNSAGSFITVQGAIDGGRFFYDFYSGETVYQLVREVQPLFLQNTDIENIYLLRDGQKIAVDCHEALSTTELGSVTLEEDDVLVVPYSQQYVTVSGGVAKPGNYEYEPDRPASYYINLAGGYSADARINSLNITDVNGNRLELSNPVPENGIVLVRKRNTNLTADITLGISLVTLGITLFNQFFNK